MEDLVKGDLLLQGRGCATFATDDVRQAIMEWEDPAICRLARDLAGTLKRHALLTNFERPHGHSALVVKRLAMLPVTVQARTGPDGVDLAFVDHAGTPVAKSTAARLPGMSKARVEVMEDTAQHAARSLRAYLGAGISLTARYGVPDGGGCLMQVIDPLECDLGGTDYEALCGLLGGQTK